MVDIERKPLPSPAWDPGQTIQSLQSLHDGVIGNAEAAALWYFRNKNAKKRASWLLRFTAILLTTCGGLVPVFIAAGVFKAVLPGTGGVDVGQVGYLLLAIAAALLGFDRFLGISSGWIRYVTTGLAIYQQMDDFRLQWQILVIQATLPVAGAPPPAAGMVSATDARTMLTALKTFAAAVDKLVADETAAWVAEFQSNLAQLDKAANAMADAQKPGVIDVKVDGYAQATGPYQVSRDGMPVGTGQGPDFPIAHVPPGTHSVTVTATVNGQPVSVTAVVTVPAGGVVAAPVKIA